MRILLKNEKKLTRDKLQFTKNVDQTSSSFLKHTLLLLLHNYYDSDSQI